VTYTFHEHGGDSTLRSRNGQSVEVVRAIRKVDNAHDREVLPMFVVRFSDGLTIETWRDELSPHRHTEAPE
jgi:hypothetical protein